MAILFGAVIVAIQELCPVPCYEVMFGGTAETGKFKEVLPLRLQLMLVIFKDSNVKYVQGVLIPQCPAFYEVSSGKNETE